MILITAIGMLTLFILAKLIYLVWPPQSGRAVAIDWNFASKFTYWQVAIRDSFDFFGVGFSLLQFFKVDCRMYLMAGALAFFSFGIIASTIRHHADLSPWYLAIIVGNVALITALSFAFAPVLASHYDGDRYLSFRYGVVLVDKP